MTKLRIDAEQVGLEHGRDAAQAGKMDKVDILSEQLAGRLQPSWTFGLRSSKTVSSSVVRRLPALMAGAMVMAAATFVVVPAAQAETGTAEAERTSATDPSLLGSYLAGRYAILQRDANAASQYFGRALKREPGDGFLVERAFLMQALRGDWREGRLLAEQLVALSKSPRFARMFLALRAFKARDYALADEHLRAAAETTADELTNVVTGGEYIRPRQQLVVRAANKINALTITLTRAWVAAARGNVDRAFALLAQGKRSNWSPSFLDLQVGLIADVAGRVPRAGRALETAFRADRRLVRPALALAQHRAKLGNFKAARAVLRDHVKAYGGLPHPLVLELQSKLDRAQTPPFLVTTYREGLAAVLSGLGRDLGRVGGRARADSGLTRGTLFMQLALYLEPQSVQTLMGLARVQRATGKFKRAIATYASIPSGSPFQPNIDIGRALLLNRLERTDEAVAILQAMLRDLDRQDVEAKKALSNPPAAVESSAAQALFSRTDMLKLGAKGNRVAKLQQMLTTLQVYDGAADGDFGAATEDAVRRLQKRGGLEVDGIAGAATLKLVDQQLAAQRTTSATQQAAFERRRRARADRDQRLRDNMRVQIHSTLGSMMISDKKYLNAVGHYTDAIKIIGTPTPRDWRAYFSRGTAFERLKRWPEAERDLQRALKLSPNQASVLNYLGYSWIDQGLNLRKGMALIEKAVRLKPNDGFITDSLGWAHYKLGNFPEAVRHLERAVELRPEDPVLNDHLGDAYWKVGRRDEARAQWREVLTLSPTDEDRAKVRRKLRFGLDQKPSVRVAPRTPA
ncbi:MAG: tetratricopeptide repeat protein, partial [Pseudomonadota bacterium]